MLEKHAHDSLSRSLSLWQVVLYGLGVTIGAGIYVLVGVAAGRSGSHAALAFVAAAALLSFTAASFAELATRMPVAASEAAYVAAAFDRNWLTLLVGLFVVIAAAISAATVSVGAAGYVGVFIPASPPILICMVVISMGAVASLTTSQSVTVAGLMTVVEIGGLLAIVMAGAFQPQTLLQALPDVWPGASMQAWTGVFGTSLLAVFAFIGFEHVVNIAEEVHNPKQLLPRALFLTLGLTAALYALVVFIATAAVAPAELAASSAPLALAYERLTGQALGTMSAVAVIATLNGIVVHMILISRVVFGLARDGRVPAWLAHIHPRTRTPLRATALAVIAILLLALAFPIAQLAQFTAQGTLAIFMIVNAALFWIKKTEIAPPKDIYQVPIWVPCVGLAANAFLLFSWMVG